MMSGMSNVKYYEGAAKYLLQRALHLPPKYATGFLNRVFFLVTGVTSI